MRRKVLLAICLLLNLSHTTIAQAADDEMQTQVLKLMEVTGALDMATQVVDMLNQNMAQAARAQNPGLDPRALEIQREVLTEHIGNFFRSPAFVEGVVGLYTKYFTLDEIKSAIAFYQTPAGKKFVSNQGALAQESAMMTQRLLPTVMPLMQRDLMEKLEAEGLSLQAK